METVNQEEQLARIAKALESIDSSLSEISISLDGLNKTLDGCSCASGRNDFYVRHRGY